MYYVEFKKKILLTEFFTNNFREEKKIIHIINTGKKVTYPKR